MITTDNDPVPALSEFPPQVQDAVYDWIVRMHRRRLERMLRERQGLKQEDRTESSMSNPDTPSTME